MATATATIATMPSAAAPSSELRRTIATHEELRKKIEQMERRYDSKSEIVFSAIKQMLEPPAKPKTWHRISPTSEAARDTQKPSATS